MIDQICAYIHNWFVYGRTSGVFTIENGNLELPFLVEGQYFRICGSRFNDGVHQYPNDELTDETFEGVIWEMRPPRDFLMLVDEITEWNGKYGDAVNSPYQSESFGGYSYTLASGTGNNGASTGAGWQNTFRHRLNQWRKLA